jgi:alkylation response protein AidB-like acyl-CoA dehydrogenase
VGNLLANMATKLVAAQQLVQFAARKYDLGERSDTEAGMAKLFASEAAAEITLVRRPPGARNAPLMIVGEGTNEIQRDVIAAQLVQRGGLR